MTPEELSRLETLAKEILVQHGGLPSVCTGCDLARGVQALCFESRALRAQRDQALDAGESLVASVKRLQEEIILLRDVGMTSFFGRLQIVKSPQVPSGFIIVCQDEFEQALKDACRHTIRIPVDTAKDMFAPGPMQCAHCGKLMP